MDWNARYHADNTPWLRPGLNPAFLHWFEGKAAFALSGKTVLIPGCGTAPEVLAFAKAGADVTAIDIAPAAIDKQKAAFAAAGLDGALVTADLARWRPASPFDAIYEQTCLCAIPPSIRVDYERFVFDCLAPDGMLFALFMQTGKEGGPPFHCDLAEMRDLFSPERWHWQEEAPYQSSHPAAGSEYGYRLTRLG